MTRLLLVLAVVATGTGPAAAQRPSRLRGDGVEVFAGLLNFHGLVPTTPEEFAKVPPAGRVMVFLEGRPVPDPQLNRLARDTLAGGGSVLWATDRGLDLDAAFGAASGLRTSGFGALPPDGSPCLNDDRNFPLLTQRPPSRREQLMPDKGFALPDPATLLLTGLTRVAAQNPGLVVVSPGGGYAWAELADLPRGTVAVGERRGLTPVVMASTSGTGAKTHRGLVVANSRVFGNRLLAAEGTDNLAFANNVVAWLSAGGSRKACLLVRDGTPVPRFDAVTFAVPPPTPPVPPLPDFLDPAVQAKLTALANETLGKLEANNDFNRLAVGDVQGEPDRLRRVLKGLGVGLAALLLALALRRLLAAKHSPDHTPVARDPARPGGPDAAARQRDEALHGGDYGGLVAEYLRDWFAACGASAQATLPEIRVRPGVPEKPLRADLAILWGVAFAAPATGRAARAGRHAVPYSRWKRLEPSIHAAQAAHEAGDWRFAELKEPA